MYIDYLDTLLTIQDDRYDDSLSFASKDEIVSQVRIYESFLAQ